eukprot:1162028-Pelagomonas_calceolata.AAC.11
MHADPCRMLDRCKMHRRSRCTGGCKVQQRAQEHSRVSRLRGHKKHRRVHGLQEGTRCTAGCEGSQAGAWLTRGCMVHRRAQDAQQGVKVHRRLHGSQEGTRCTAGCEGSQEGTKCTGGCMVCRRAKDAQVGAKYTRGHKKHRQV